MIKPDLSTSSLTQEFEPFEILFLVTGEPFINLGGLYVYPDNKLNQDLFDHVQLISNDYGVVTITQDKIFFPEKKLDYEFLKYSHLQDKLSVLNEKKSVRGAKNNKIKGLEFELKKRLSSIMVYDELKTGCLDFSSDNNKFYLNLLEKKGFILFDGYYFISQQRDYIIENLKQIYR